MAAATATLSERSPVAHRDAHAGIGRRVHRIRHAGALAAQQQRVVAARRQSRCRPGRRAWSAARGGSRALPARASKAAKLVCRAISTWAGSRGRRAAAPGRSCRSRSGRSRRRPRPGRRPGAGSCPYSVECPAGRGRGACAVVVSTRRSASGCPAPASDAAACAKLPSHGLSDSLVHPLRRMQKERASKRPVGGAGGDHRQFASATHVRA